MKNFIKNFSQFQRLNEQARANQPNDPDGFVSSSEVLFPVFEDYDLIDAVTDRLYENIKNGTLGSSDTIQTKDKVYPSVGIDFVENKLLVEVGEPIPLDDFDPWDDIEADDTVFETISILIKQAVPNVSVSYSGGESDDIEYGPYEDFYNLTNSISQYIINRLEGRPGKAIPLTKADIDDLSTNIELDDFKQEDSGYERPGSEYNDDDIEIDF